MFKKIEHISNLIGKKLLHFIFICAIFFQCKSCASYILFAEENFKCPICEIIKGFSNPKITFYNGVIIYKVSLKVILPNQKQQVEDIQESLVENNSNNQKYLKEHYYKIPPSIIIHLKSHTRIQHHLFILYQQLKVDPDSYV
jgi:hypothetical protein